MTATHALAALHQLSVTASQHRLAVPLGVVALVLFVVAAVVRKIIKLALLLLLAGAAALAFAVVHSGAFSS